MLSYLNEKYMSISSYSSSSQISSTRLTIILALCSSLLSPYHAQNCTSIIILSLDIVSDDTMTTSYIVSKSYPSSLSDSLNL